IRTLNRLENVTTTLQHALNVLAQTAPEWVLEHCPLAWGVTYGARVDNYRLPKAETERTAYAEQVGADGHQLLEAIYAAAPPACLRQVPAVETLRQVWLPQFYRQGEQWRWRTQGATGLPPAAVMIQSPQDGEARYAEKRGAGWVGYKVHLTETCDGRPAAV